MAEKYAAYPEYKDSGVDWLGEIPKDWGVERVKQMLTLKRNLVGKASHEYQLLSLTLKGIIPRDISNGEGKIPASFDAYQEVNINDLVFCLFDIDETPRTIGLSPTKGMITGAYNVYQTTNNCLPSYAYYYFLYIDLRKGLRPFYTGLRKVVRSETFSNIEMPCPSYEEQTQIANFLDHETAKIDTLIDKQQSLITLLQEKRQAVISHAVTKGLNPDAPMKDSGVEWLGEVPAHWVVTRIKYITSMFEQGWSPQCDSRPAGSNEYGVLKVGCVNYGCFHSIENKALPPELKPRLQYLLKKRDLLISRANTKELVGSAAVVDDNYDNLLLCDKLYRLRFKANVLPELIALYLSIAPVREQVELQASGASHSMQNISQDVIKELPCFLLPIKEGHELLMFINEQIEVFDTLVMQAKQAIQLMQERRTALISAAVTGKIDVRGWQAPDK